MKLKRILKEGLQDYKQFGFTIAYRKCKCIWENNSPKSIEKKNEAILQYLERNYAQIINKYEEVKLLESSDLSTPKLIWVLWWQGKEKMPRIIKLCQLSLEKNLKDYKVILLTAENIRDYVDFPDYVWELFNEKKIRIQHLADMIRMNLLRNHGGLWLDASILVKHYIPETFFQKPFITIRSNLETKVISKNRWTTFIIGGCPGNTLFCFLDDLFMEYCKNGKPFVDYFMFDCCIELAYRKIPAIRQQIDNVNVLDGNLYWLNRKLNNDVSEDLVQSFYNEPMMFYKISWNQKVTEEQTFYAYLLNLMKETC